MKLEGAWHKNWVFVPAYNNGNAPYGKWTAAKTMSTPQWTASEDINYDVGAAVVDSLNGQKLTDVVGARAWPSTPATTSAMYAFGFPAAAPYDGTSSSTAAGTASRTSCCPRTTVCPAT